MGGTSMGRGRRSRLVCIIRRAPARHPRLLVLRVRKRLAPLTLLLACGGESSSEQGLSGGTSRGGWSAGGGASGGSTGEGGRAGVKSVVTGAANACVLLGDGTVKCWG